MRCIHFDSLGVNAGCADSHVTRLKGPRSSEPHTHDFYEAFLVLEGTGIHHFNRRRLALAAGHLVVISPEDAHWYSTVQGQDLVFVNVAVSAAWWQAFHAVLGLDGWDDERRSATLPPSEARQLGRVLNATAIRENPAALLHAWTRIRTHCLAAGDRQAEPPPAWLEALRRDLAESPDRLLEPIAFWQRRAGRSPEHLARSSRRFYGVTFSELVNRARVEHARYLLRTSDEKVTTVAFDCGFQNLAHFYRVFARLTGCTPSQWRREEGGTVPF